MCNVDPIDVIPMISKLIEQKQASFAEDWHDVIPQRRERLLVIPVCQLINILAGTVIFNLPNEIPMDSVALRTFQDQASHSICVVVCHPSFETTKPGYSIPKYDLIFHLINGVQDNLLDSNPDESDEREI